MEGSNGSAQNPNPNTKIIWKKARKHSKIHNEYESEWILEVFTKISFKKAKKPNSSNLRIKFKIHVDSTDENDFQRMIHA